MVPAPLCSAEAYLTVGRQCRSTVPQRCLRFRFFVCVLLPCAICWILNVVSGLVLPRVMWDAWPLPPDSSASVGWGKGVMRGQQFTVPRHEKRDPQPVFLPIGSQLMENGAILAVGYNSCKGPQNFEAFNREEREASKTAHGNLAAVGGGWISKECTFHLSQFGAKTGKHIHTFEYPAVQDADPVVVGFYAHDSSDKNSPKMSNALVMFVWQQQATHRQKICIANKATRIFFNGLTTDTVKALQRARAYRALFKEKDESVLRDPYGTPAHIPPIGIRLCDAFYSEKVKPEAPDLKNSFPNDYVELEPTLVDCGSSIKADKNTLPPGKGRSCLNVPFEKDEPLGSIWGRALKLDPSKSDSYPYKEWREAPSTILPVKKIPLLRGNFKNVVAIYEGNFSRPKHYSYFLLHYNYVSNPAGPPSRACFAAAMSHELRLQYIYFGCQRCGEFGLLPWKQSGSPAKAEKLFGLLIWCVEEGGHVGGKGTILQTPSLIVNGATSERTVVLSELTTDAGYPPSSILKGSYFLPWIRDIHMIPVPDSTSVYYFYVLEKFIHLRDIRFGPVAAAELRWGMFDVGDNNAAVVPSIKAPIFAEVFSPELHAFSVVPVGEKLLMLAYENAIQQTFHIFLFDPVEEQLLEGADLLFPDSQSEAYNSFAFGTDILVTSTTIAGQSKGWNEGLKLQFGRPGKGDILSDFGAPRTIAANSFSSGDMFRIKFAAQDVYCKGRWEPALRFAPCTYHCNQIQVFQTPEDASSSSQCPWKNGQHRVIPCDASPCSFLEFDVRYEPALLGSVDRNIQTAGASFAPSSLSPVTFNLKTTSDIWEVALFFKGAPEPNDFLIELFFLDGQGQEFTKREIKAGGEFSVNFPFWQEWRTLSGVRTANRAGQEQAGHSGYVVRAAFMELYGVHSIGVVYHGRENAAELLEVLVKGRPEPAVCPPHGFFTDPGICPPNDELVIPEKLSDLDCQGFWSEWSVCDHFCRQTRFFQKGRDPFLGGMPCPSLEHKPCDEGPFCRAGEAKYSALLDNFKRRDCQYDVGDWSECVNCRQLRFLHILTAAAKDGVRCPTTPPAIQTRFCDRTCEKIFAEGGVAKPDPPSTTSSTSSSSSSSSSSTTTTTTSSSSTRASTDTSAVQQHRWYLILAIVGGNLVLLLLVCVAGFYTMRARSVTFKRVLEGRKKEMELKKIICRQDAAAGKKRAAAKGLSTVPAAVKRKADTVMAPEVTDSGGNKREKRTQNQSRAATASAAEGGAKVTKGLRPPREQRSSLSLTTGYSSGQKESCINISNSGHNSREGRKRKGKRTRTMRSGSGAETPASA